MGLSQFAFMAAILLALTVAFAWGGKPERATAGVLFIASFVSPLLFDASQSGPQWRLACLDLAVLAAIHVIAIRWPRNWLDPARAFQLLAVLTHVARAFAENASQFAYASMLAFWAYPVLACLIWGALVGRKKGSVQDHALGSLGRPECDLVASEPETEHDLAIFFLRQHGVHENVEYQAGQLLKLTGSLARAIVAPSDYLLNNGINQRIVKILAGTRLLNNQLMNFSIKAKPILSDNNVLLQYLNFTLGVQPIEHFLVIYLDSRDHIIARHEHSSGTANQAPVFARKIVRDALELGAAKIILAHNHPSGDLQPSRADIAITRQLRDLFRTMDIILVDHVIVATTGHFSLRSAGFI